MAVAAQLRLDTRQHETFAALADVLLPAANGMPAWSEADRNGKWLAKALDARPDLVPTLVALLDAAVERDPGAEARRLHAEEPAAFKALADVASGAYYMNLKVRKRIG